MTRKNNNLLTSLDYSKVYLPMLLSKTVKYDVFKYLVRKGGTKNQLMIIVSATCK